MAGLVDLLLPERCVGCGLEDTPLCPRCRAELARLSAPLCDRCGAPVVWPVARCRECAGRRLAFATARAAVAYDGIAIRVVAAWKDGGRRRLAVLAGDLVAEAVPRPEVKAIGFVPAVPDRFRWRGHNPAESLAETLATRWRLPLGRMLRRTSAPRPQRGLALSERRLNVAGAFAATSSVPRSVALVDDVYTSGSTVSSAASALRQGGAERVEVVTLARALRGR